MNAKARRPCGRTPCFFRGVSRAAQRGFQRGMVNDKFSERAALWFRNGRYGRSRKTNRHQLKIFRPGQIGQFFSQIFGELRQAAMTCDL